MAHSILYLQLDALGVEPDCLDLAVDAECSDKGRGETILSEGEETTWLANVGVTKEEAVYITNPS